MSRLKYDYIKPARVKTLLDAASAVECELAYLEETLTALEPHYDVIEEAGYQSQEHFEAWRAIAFGREFPQHHATLRLILESLTRHISALREVDTAIYTAAHAEKKETANAKRKEASR